MPGKGDAVADRSPSLVPLIVCEHPDDVAEVRVLEGFQLFIRFFDGTEGVVHMSDLIHSSEAGVFGCLADPARFGEAGIEFGAVTWPGGIDLAPDAMYEALSKTGQWVLR